MPRRILIVGGVAGGASCATRVRRLDENAEITIFERGPHASFANCGLPYYVGKVIDSESKLIVASAHLFEERFNIKTYLKTEVTAIHRQQQEIEVREVETGHMHRERYDVLVLSPGAAAIRPPLPGIELPGIFTLRTIPDSQRIRRWIDQRSARSAIIIGAGFIGLEMAENLVRRGLEVTMIEMANQVLPPLDPEMAYPVQQRLTEKGVKALLGDGVAGFEPEANGSLIVRTKSGAAHGGDLVLLAIGVRPETSLAWKAGLDLGERGGIRVNAQMQTSDPNIFAVGDAVEVRDFVTGQWALIPLAGPASRQGRVAADVICGRQAQFRGTQGTAICGVLGLTVAMTSASEKSLKRAGIADYDKIYLHPGQHAGYFPDARPMGLKLLFRKSNGAILGAQAYGEEGVDKRIDVIAMAIQKGGTVFDLAEAELCYAPQYGAAKDPVNMAGMIAANATRGLMHTAEWESPASNGFLLLDVRDSDEFADGHIPQARNIPLHQLRHRLSEIPTGQPIYVYCAVGQRAYYASRTLRQNGRRAFILSGGYKTYLNYRHSGVLRGLNAASAIGA